MGFVVGGVAVLKILLITFGAGVQAPPCAQACSDASMAGRWLVIVAIAMLIAPLLHRAMAPRAPPPDAPARKQG